MNQKKLEQAFLRAPKTRRDENAATKPAPIPILVTRPAQELRNVTNVITSVPICDCNSPTNPWIGKARGNVLLVPYSFCG
jgi:hypothetical protein